MVTFVQAIFVLVALVHISNISALEILEAKQLPLLGKSRRRRGPIVDRYSWDCWTRNHGMLLQDDTLLLHKRSHLLILEEFCSSLLFLILEKTGFSCTQLPSWYSMPTSSRPHWCRPTSSEFRWWAKFKSFQIT